MADMIGVRLARCGNFIERTEDLCRGLLAFQPGDTQAACSRCQAWCGSQVARYIGDPEVERLRAQHAAALAIADRWLAETLPEPNRWIYANGAGYMIRRALGAEDTP